MEVNPFNFFINLIYFQAAIISTCFRSLSSPFFSIIAFFFPKKEPSESRFLLWRVAAGFLAAAYVCILLMAVMVVAAVLGVGLVRMWSEEPLYVRETLQLDYRDAHPSAVFVFGGLPVGQTLYVSLAVVMPESEYNRDIGIFQLSAELISIEGVTVVKASHPCMLQFTSLPIRMMRTFLMGIPLLLGFSSETQTLAFPILKHKETSHPRTHRVRITMAPRAGTWALPQFYDAELVLISRLSSTKELVYRWKWTFYVWTTLYIFIILVVLLVVFLKPVILPTMGLRVEPQYSLVVSEEPEVSESLRRWQRSRNRRKALLLHERSADSSASSISIAAPFEEGSGDSESVCLM